MISIEKIDMKRVNDVWLIIRECSEWLDKNDLDHWVGYYTFEKVKEKLKTSDIFCMYEKGSPVATVSLSKKNPEYYSDCDLKNFSHIANNKTLFISALGVRPAFQGKGYAKTFLSFCENYARKSNFEAIGFDARRKYKKLIEFYLKLGFVEIGNMNDEGESYVLFEKAFA